MIKNKTDSIMKYIYNRMKFNNNEEISNGIERIISNNNEIKLSKENYNILSLIDSKVKTLQEIQFINNDKFITLFKILYFYIYSEEFTYINNNNNIIIEFNNSILLMTMIDSKKLIIRKYSNTILEQFN